MTHKAWKWTIVGCIVAIVAYFTTPSINPNVDVVAYYYQEDTLSINDPSIATQHDFLLVRTLSHIREDLPENEVNYLFNPDRYNFVTIYKAYRDYKIGILYDVYHLVFHFGEPTIVLQESTYDGKYSSIHVISWPSNTVAFRVSIPVEGELHPILRYSAADYFFESTPRLISATLEDLIPLL